MTFDEKVKEVAERYAQKFMISPETGPDDAMMNNQIEEAMLSHISFGAAIAKKEFEEQIASRDAEIESYLKTIIRLKSENDDMKLAGTPYWKERDLMNSYVLENSRLAGLIKEAKKWFNNFNSNWDCDWDAHKYTTPCRKCISAIVLAKLASKGINE